MRAPNCGKGRPVGLIATSLLRKMENFLHPCNVGFKNKQSVLVELIDQNEHLGTSCLGYATEISLLK